MEKTAHPVGLVAAVLGVLGPTLTPLCAQGPPQGGVVRISRTHTPPAIEDFVAGDPPESTLTVTEFRQFEPGDGVPARDRKSTRLNSSHLVISYAVFCLK